MTKVAFLITFILLREEIEEGKPKYKIVRKAKNDCNYFAIHLVPKEQPEMAIKKSDLSQLGEPDVPRILRYNVFETDKELYNYIKSCLPKEPGKHIKTVKTGEMEQYIIQTDRELEGEVFYITKFRPSLK